MTAVQFLYAVTAVCFCAFVVIVLLCRQIIRNEHKRAQVLADMGLDDVGYEAAYVTYVEEAGSASRGRR